MCSSTSNEHKIWSTAYHEAGHAFMLILFGHNGVEIIVNESEEGEVRYSSYVAPESLIALIEKYIFACIAIAGSVSEDKFMDRKNPGYSLLYGGGADAEQYQKLRLPHGSFLPLLDATNEIIEENWKLISKIADAAYIAKYLSKKEIDQLLSGVDMSQKRVMYEQKLENLELETAQDA